jgi:hypothetical protein
MNTTQGSAVEKRPLDDPATGLQLRQCNMRHLCKYMFAGQQTAADHDWRVSNAAHMYCVASRTCVNYARGDDAKHCRLPQQSRR